LAPHDAMQFGRALERLLFCIRHANPCYGPVYLNKIDISDGFYRVALAASSAPKLAVVLPTRPDEPTLLAIPLSLPMGWIESPPAFCSVTETVADITNARLPRRYAPPHRLEKFADTPPPVAEANSPSALGPLCSPDVDTSSPPWGPYAPANASPTEALADLAPPVAEAESPSALGPLCSPVVDTSSPQWGPCAPANASPT
jgi:hypothetical protein